MNKKVNWTLSIIILLSIITFCLDVSDEVDEITYDFGKNFNKSRIKLDIPLIEDHRVLHDHDSVYSVWMNSEHRLLTPEPTHFYKEIRLKHGLPKTELDAFHYVFNDSISFRLISTFSFVDSTRKSRMITYFRDRYPPTSSQSLSINQADSILSSWAIN